MKFPETTWSHFDKGSMLLRKNAPLFALVLTMWIANIACAQSPRTTLNFDADWRFFKGDPTVPLDPSSHAFKDDDWRKLNLPHDWSIEGPFDEHAPSGSAGANLPTGVAWYRKTFTLPDTAAGKRVFIEFDGIMANSEVFINKSVLGHHPNGYVGLRYELTNYLDYKGPNVLAVRVDNSRQPGSRWYAGAGIYRHVRMVFENEVHIESGSTFITTPTVDKTHAIVHVKTTVVNQSSASRSVSLRMSALPVGVAVNYRSLPVLAAAKEIPAGKSVEFEADIPVPAPHLWEPANPICYGANIEVLDGEKFLNGEKSLDEQGVRFGIRTAEFKPDTGFWLNGKNIKLLGIALHSDAGGLGVAVPISVWETRLALLKKLGCNAIRTAHNPPSPEFLDICDRMGFLVMDEVFDAWTIGKETADYHLYFKDWWQKDLEATMKRDRNHPSIVLWSLGNEILDILPQNPDPLPDQFVGPIRNIENAKATFLPMRDLAHELDPTRPVTLAILRPNVAGAYTNGFADLMDVVGQNYRDSELAAAHVQNPRRIIVGTENYQTLPTWIALRDNPALAGQFIWAGFDYLGEAGKWPNIVSPSGLFDRTNFPKGSALEREAWWSTSPVLHIVRMKTIPTRPGAKPVNIGFADWTPTDPSVHDEDVCVYSNCDEVELFLNNTSLGVKAKDPGDAARQWKVPFAAGSLRAVGKNKGEVAAQDEIKTAHAPARIELKSEHDTLYDDWDDVTYVRVSVVDANGTVNPNATNKIHFALTGPGEIAALDNGDITSHESFQGNERSAYGGTCIAVLRATATEGNIVLTATADGLADGSVTVKAELPLDRDN